MVLTYELAACPWPFSMIARYGRETNPPLSLCWMTWHPAATNNRIQQCTPLTVGIFYIVLFGSIQQRMDIIICEQYKQYTTMCSCRVLWI